MDKELKNPMAEPIVPKIVGYINLE